MGSKIKQIFLILCMCLVFAAGHTGFAKQYFNTTSPVIKVGIMDNGFKTLERGSVSLYGTDTLYICDFETKHTIETVHEYMPVTFTIKDGIINFSYNDKDYSSENGFMIACPKGVIGVKELRRAGKQALYRGAFRVQKNTNPNAIYLINYIELEDYLKGVISNEMPTRFGLEALKAQAVAARNYAISPRTKNIKIYDVVDSVASQVYFGYNTETELGNRAVKETEGIVALYNHLPIIALYSSCPGGYTENYSYVFSDPDTKQFPSPIKPYLISKPDIQGIVSLNRDENAYEYYSTKPKSYDVKSPYYRWTRSWTREEMEQILQQNLPKQSKTGFVKPIFSDNDSLGTLKNIKVARRGNSGKVVYLDIITSNGKYRVEKELVIRRLLTKDGKALPSANIAFKIEHDEYGVITDINLVGGGLGHGVGMSQYGASYMALELKKNFIDILKHYYTGINLGTQPVEISDSIVTRTFCPPSNKAILMIPDRKHIDLLQLVINGKSCNIDLSQYLNIQRCEVDISQYINKGRENKIEYLPITGGNNEKKDIKINIYIKFL